MTINLLDSLPTYPWDQLAKIKAKAASHPDGIVDLSIGSPVDETPEVIQSALSAAANAHAYPTAAGTPQLRKAIVDWYARRRNVHALTEQGVVSTIGSKEIIAQLPAWMGLGAADAIVQPSVHYPTYAIGAQVSGAQVVSADDPNQWPANTRLVWLNSPGNPDGVVHDIAYLREAVARARELGALIIQDECYAELGWGPRWGAELIPSILDPRVVGEDLHGVLSIYSLSKQSNLAGYRAALAAGDPELVQKIINVRKQLGLSLPAPIQAAMVTALGDDAHVAKQRARYLARREALLPAVNAWGITVQASEAGLYLWGTAGEDCFNTLDRLADIGIMAAPGSFYGTESSQYVRFAITATDASIQQAVTRLGVFASQ